MDSATVNDAGRCDDVGLRCLPPERPGSMPEQSLRTFDKDGRPSASGAISRLGIALRRWFVFGGALLVAGFAVYEMFLVLKIGGLTPLEMVVLALFAINTVWISLPTVNALVGLLRLLARRKRQPDRSALATRTALLMPLYNEDPARAGAALDAVARELLEQGEPHSFDIFILSDTTDGNIALAEEEMFAALRQRFGAVTAIYYRRRVRNTAHKAGNIAEFCTRWGRAYDYFLVLDADSLMDGATIVELAHRMDKDPNVGLIQTIPRLHEGMTPIAQSQQFAASVYGPVLAAGLAWWTGGEGNYWGHNAIIRSDAFMQSAGLPKLSGAPPLGGYILSHDFVEAALLRRAGWKVVIADDLQGSYEASPPTLVDLSLRDRRWCQGNLQHARLLWTRGLHWISRFHLLTGMFTFLSSPFWLLFIVATLALAVQNLFATPEYFSSNYTLFPLWPHLDPLRALRLFYLTIGILVVPKALGFIYFAASPRRLRAAGPLFPFSIALELALSALVAPILMLMHCGFVMAVLGGGDSGWKPQRRGDRGLPWSTIAYRHRWHVLAGVVLTMVAWTVSLRMLEWLLPAVAGLVLAVPLSIASGSAAVGAWFSRLGLLRSPLEANPPPVRLKMDEALPFYRARVEQAPDLSAIVVDGDKLRRHLSMVDQVPKRFGEPIDVLEATADLKVRAARTVEEAVSQMTAEERAFVQSAPDLLLQLAGLPRRTTSVVRN